MRTALVSFALLIIFGFTLLPSDHNKGRSHKPLTDSCTYKINVKNNGTPTIGLSASDADETFGPIGLAPAATTSWTFHASGNDLITICLFPPQSRHRSGRLKLTGPNSTVIFCVNMADTSISRICATALLRCDSTYFLEYKDTTCPN